MALYISRLYHLQLIKIVYGLINKIVISNPVWKSGVVRLAIGFQAASSQILVLYTCMYV